MSEELGKGPLGPKGDKAGKAAAKGSLSPALQQFFEVKAQAPEAILFFQVGDFYELFFEDATLAAPLLDLVLTSRQKIDGQPVPLCGMPMAAADNYINRLVALGHKVAVCDQVGKVEPGGGLARRRLTRVVTPATVLTQESQPQSRYLATMFFEGEEYALAAVDLATGDFAAGRFFDFPSLRTAVQNLDPAEIVIESGEAPQALEGGHIEPAQEGGQGAKGPQSGPLASHGADMEAQRLIEGLAGELGVLTTRLARENFDSQLGRSELAAALGGEQWGEAFSGCPALMAATGATLAYLKGLAGGQGLRHLSPPRLLWERGHMLLDEAATRNLELFKPARDGNQKATLIAQIDFAKTAMGTRQIRDWLARPLTDPAAIEERLEAVGSLVSGLMARQDLADTLGQGGDLERALSRLALGRGTVRDLQAVRGVLERAPRIKELLSQSPSAYLSRLGQNLDPMGKLLSRVSATLEDEIPPGATEFLVKMGLSPALDELRDLERGGRQAIAALEASEKRKTGINSLKVGYNRVYGYYLEVTKLNLASVPKEWTRKQTIANGERFVTQELKEWEEKILNAGERRKELENRILANLKDAVAREVASLKALASAMAQADALCALATAAERHGWVRPKFTADNLIDITGGRHPVVERFLPPGEAFVANDVRLSRSERLLIVTGPNMAGKSTILRQTALIVILGQMGSFVPAEKAVLSVRDQVFTRVGAADDLARGQSTFMVEMSETSRILKKATSRSLVILDEVGRGTSTYDGLAIAWAVAERLHDISGLGVPTLFATHYHELTELPRHKTMARNFNVSAKRWGQTVVFLRKLVPGGVSRSFGLDVASLAGLPPEVVKRAREVLSDLGRQSSSLIRAPGQRESLFSSYGLDQDGPTSLAREISQIKTEELTPIAALNLLVDLKSRAR
ncbi:MAG: DNA mismatch repair protein MutS, partial [Deltaproteobacteria bacterium]|nr:DNA mismatch repair protein MutS [Deltaproteobacteria bacterium]